MIHNIILLITVGVAFIDDTAATEGTNDPIKLWFFRFDCFQTSNSCKMLFYNFFIHSYSSSLQMW